MRQTAAQHDGNSPKFLLDVCVFATVSCVIGIVWQRPGSPSHGFRSGEGAKPSYDGPVSPTGPEFPQALLTSRRPVIPPDRAPFLCKVPLLEWGCGSCV